MNLLSLSELPLSLGNLCLLILDFLLGLNYLNLHLSRLSIRLECTLRRLGDLLLHSLELDVHFLDLGFQLNYFHGKIIIINLAPLHALVLTGHELGVFLLLRFELYLLRSKLCLHLRHLSLELLLDSFLLSLGLRHDLILLFRSFNFKFGLSLGGFRCKGLLLCLLFCQGRLFCLQ